MNRIVAATLLCAATLLFALVGGGSKVSQLRHQVGLSEDEDGHHVDNVIYYTHDEERPGERRLQKKTKAPKAPKITKAPKGTKAPKMTKAPKS